MEHFEDIPASPSREPQVDDDDDFFAVTDDRDHNFELASRDKLIHGLGNDEEAYREREWNRMMAMFSEQGYRETISELDEDDVQAGFEHGFFQGWIDSQSISRIYGSIEAILSIILSSAHENNPGNAFSQCAMSLISAEEMTLLKKAQVILQKQLSANSQDSMKRKCLVESKLNVSMRKYEQAIKRAHGEPLHNAQNNSGSSIICSNTTCREDDTHDCECFLVDYENNEVEYDCIHYATRLERATKELRSIIPDLSRIMGKFGMPVN